MTNDEYQEKVLNLKLKTMSTVSELVALLDDPTEAYKRANKEYAMSLIRLLSASLHSMDDIYDRWEELEEWANGDE